MAGTELIEPRSQLPGRPPAAPFEFNAWIQSCLLYTALFALALSAVEVGVKQALAAGRVGEVLGHVLLLSFLGGFAFGTIMHLATRSSAVAVTGLRRIDDDADELARHLGTPDFFTALVRINFKYIDKYYLQTQLQADKGFLLSAIAAGVSFLIVCGALIGLFLGKFEFRVAAIATAAGVLGEFVSAVFFTLYSRTVAKMSEYHQKLVLTQNVSLALKIAEDLPDTSRVEAKLKLIEVLSKDVNQYLVQGAITITAAKER